MDTNAITTFNEYRELTKIRAEVNKQIDTIKPTLRSFMTNGQLLNESTGELLVEIETTKKRIFNQEDFASIYPDLFNDFCYDKEKERIIIKSKS